MPRNTRTIGASVSNKAAMTGPDHSAAAAREADAADDDGGDAAQRVIGARQGSANSGRHGQRHAAECAGDSAEDIGDRARSHHVDAASKRGDRIAARGVDQKADAAQSDR